jgi:ATP-dependent RNA helicase RhlE
MIFMENFEGFQLNRQLLNAIQDSGYQSPTPIQEQAMPLVLAGHDVLGIAQTGTGKTAAYVLPILMKIKYAQGTLPRALILAPTRELVMQIDVAITDLAKYTDIRHVALYGGIGPKTQIETIQKGVDILVATPGRFMDLYLREEIGVKELKTLVLDEADKMMDMGFMRQIRKILEVIPSKKRQNLLFSATFPPRVEELSHEFLEFPTKVEVTPQATTATRINQKIYELPNFKTKINLIGVLMSDYQTFKKVIIFCRSKEVADNIFKFLERKIVAAGKVKVIHANKGQNTRINSMDAFREGEVQVLVATDVASRGIDIEEVSHVINFDVPLIYEDYVHRIGRTGRANHNGEAITFMTISDEYHIQKIEKIIKMKIPREALPQAGLTIEPTPAEEQKEMLREIDNQRKKEDPDFKGAFHEKKDPRARAREKAKKQSGKSPEKVKAAFKPNGRNYGISKKSGGSSSSRGKKK